MGGRSEKAPDSAQSLKLASLRRALAGTKLLTGPILKLRPSYTLHPL